MLGQIKVEFIFAVVIFGLIILFIASQINMMLTISLTTSKSDDLRAKAVSVMTALVEDKGEPEDWDQPQEIPVDVMLVIDRSGSMDDDCSCSDINTCTECVGPCKICDAKTAAKTFVDIMNPTLDKIGLVSFSSSATLDQNLTFEYIAVKNGIDSLSANGYTAIGSAIDNAILELMSTRARPYVDKFEILLSDGMNNRGRNPLDSANDAAAAGIIIYTIGLGSDADNETLENIAEITGGKFYFAPNSTELEKIYEEIAIIIKIDPLRLGLVDQKPYQLNINKTLRLNTKCTLLDIFDLKGYRLKIYQEEQQVLFCGYKSLVPPTTIITKNVFIDGTSGNISLELWL